MLDDITGAVLATAVTNASGRYAFDAVAIGSYKVRFSGLPVGFMWVPEGVGADSNVDSDANPTTGVSGTIVVGPDAPNLRAKAASDLPSRATKIDSSIDAGRRIAVNVASTSVCIAIL